MVRETFCHVSRILQRQKAVWFFSPRRQGSQDKRRQHILKWLEGNLLKKKTTNAPLYICTLKSTVLANKTSVTRNYKALNFPKVSLIWHFVRVVVENIYENVTKFYAPAFCYPAQESKSQWCLVYVAVWTILWQLPVEKEEYHRKSCSTTNFLAARRQECVRGI